jgi:DNA-binding transcriptional LysR family regulator
MSCDAIWFVPWSAVHHDVETGALVTLPRPTTGSDDTGLMARSIGLIMRSNSLPTSVTQALISVIRECALERRTEMFY